jgi:hypothetical protein
MESPMTDPRPACAADEEIESLGGDPPCWAHLFEDDEESDSSSEPVSVTILHSSTESVE